VVAEWEGRNVARPNSSTTPAVGISNGVLLMSIISNRIAYMQSKRTLNTVYDDDDDDDDDGDK
jgi:hypothetical protein